MSSIPNVSSIFRDLSHLHSSIGISKQPNISTYSLEPQVTPSRPAHEDLYTYKQKRHNELMAKLKNSYEEHQHIVGGLGMVNTNSHTGWARTDVYNGSSYDNSSSIPQQNSYSSTNSVSYVRPSDSDFVMPKIKYRHIEDQNQSSAQSNRTQVQNTNDQPEFEQLQK